TGGLGVSLDDFGNILATWALVQCIVPVFTGGLSDRYGYKQTIAASTVIKICGYLTMAAFTTYYGFFARALILACGTAVVKPGIEDRLSRARAETGPRQSLASQSLAELRKPHVWPYLLVFSGFWFMFNSLFDVLPAHIEDWVDTRDIVRTLFGANAHPSAVVSF